MAVEIVPRAPTAAEFAAITAAVGFKPHSEEAIVTGLANSFGHACAVADGIVIGVGRLLGDGAMTFCLTGVMVHPAWQRQGIGTRIVEALIDRVKMLPYTNTLIEATPLPGLESFYARFKAQRSYAPGMALWINDASKRTQQPITVSR